MSSALTLLVSDPFVTVAVIVAPPGLTPVTRHPLAVTSTLAIPVLLEAQVQLAATRGSPPVVPTVKSAVSPRMITAAPSVMVATNGGGVRTVDLTP